MPEQQSNASEAPPDMILGLAVSAAPQMTLSERVLALFQQLRAPVFRFLIRKTHNAAKAEDLTQEAFLRLLNHLRQERPLNNPKAWLFTVANNLVIDEHRIDRNLRDVDGSTWERIEDSRCGGECDPEHLALESERLDRLHMAVLNLTPLQRQCLHLRAEGLRYREVAELLDISVSTVVDAIRRAVVKLARDMTPEMPS